MEVIKSAQDYLNALDITFFNTQFSSLEKEIQNNSNYSDEFIEKLRQFNKTKEILDNIANLNKKISEFNDTLELVKDLEMKEIAESEQINIVREIEIQLEKLKDLTKKPLPNDEKKAIVEIRPGVGGIEASLFAEDLLNMYLKYTTEQKIKTEILSIEYNLEGGINEGIFRIDEAESFGKFRFEAGVHRVQRIPTTEALGRIHTSTAAVMVLPEFSANEVKINMSDIRVDVYRSGGPGGQGVNTTDSAVRIVHIPTGIVVTCQNGRSQIQNKQTALTVLYSKLQELEKNKQSDELKNLKEETVSSSDRSSKIRTYNFPQGRITDHRIGQSWFNIKEVMQGFVGDIIDEVNRKLRAGEVKSNVEEESD